MLFLVVRESVKENVGVKFRPRRHRILLEIRETLAAQDIFIDEEMPGDATAVPYDDRVGRIGHDRGFAASRQRLRENTSTAAVAMVVRGHNEFTAMPCAANSADMPRVHMLMPYFAMV